MRIPPSEFDKYVSLVGSMCLDCQLGGITRETWQSNLIDICANLSAPEVSECAAVQLFFKNKDDREEFIQAIKAAYPNLTARPL